MALAAVAATVGNAVVSAVSFKPSSASRAQKVIPSVIQSAEAGNLTAMRCMGERRGFGVQAERAVWNTGYESVKASHPNVEKAMHEHWAKIPQPDHTSPESAAASALAKTYFVNVSNATASAVAPGTSVPPTAENAALAAAGAATENLKRLPWWAMAILVGSIAWVVYKEVLKRGR